MAYAVNTTTYGFPERVLAGAALLLQTAAARYARYRIYRASVAELRALSARDLADIGLNKSMIKSVALEAADKHLKF